MNTAKNEKLFCRFKSTPPLTNSQVSRKKWAERLFVVGSIVLFASWMYDNYTKRDWEEKNRDADYRRSTGISMRTNLYVLNFQVEHFRLQFMRDSINPLIRESLLLACRDYCNMLVYQRAVITGLLK